MKVFREITLEEFEPWAGAIETKDLIIKKGKEKEFNVLIEECYPEGITETGLNDLLRFEEKWIYKCLGLEITEEDNEEEETI